MNKFTVLMFSLFSLICIICVISAGCGAGNMELRRSGSTGFDNDIDPFDFGDEFLLKTVNYLEPDTGADSDRNISDTQTDSGLLSKNEEKTSQPENSASENEKNTAFSGFGYRVQIGRFNSRVNADILAERARSRMEYPVYVEYITPFYRVRVGDFILKSDAEECVEFLKQKRFRDSIYVYTNINSQ